MPTAKAHAFAILAKSEQAQIELVGGAVIPTDGKAGTVENIWLPHSTVCEFPSKVMKANGRLHHKIRTVVAKHNRPNGRRFLWWVAKGLHRYALRVCFERDRHHFSPPPPPPPPPPPACGPEKDVAMTGKYAPPEVTIQRYPDFPICDVVVVVRGREMVHRCRNYRQAAELARMDSKGHTKFPSPISIFQPMRNPATCRFFRVQIRSSPPSPEVNPLSFARNL